jgi:hypothetical protein
MFVVGFPFFVTSDAGKYRVIIGIQVAIRTTVPNSLVSSTIYWEERTIVIESCRHPAGIGSVALDTICWEARACMIWIGGIGIIIHMAGKTICTYITKVIHVMTSVAIGYVVTSGKRKEIMYDARGIPAKSQGRMTIDTILRKANRHMVWILSCQVVVPVAFDTFISEARKDQAAFVGMTFHATQIAVCTNQGKTVFLMDLGNIKNKPIFGSMTPHTIISYRSPMHIGMARKAIGGSLIENQISMAGFTI